MENSRQLSVLSVVLLREEVKLKILFRHLLWKRLSVGKTLKVLWNFFSDANKLISKNLLFIFSNIFWAPTPVNWYEIGSRFGPGIQNPVVFFSKIVYCWKLLAIVTKAPSKDVWQGFEYASGFPLWDKLDTNYTVLRSHYLR